MNQRQFVDHLERLGYRVQWRGRQARAQCPGHGGEGLNLAIDQGEHGGVLVTCHSQKCDVAKIAAGAGLTVADLQPPRPNGPQREAIETAYPYRDEEGRTLFWVGRTRTKEFPGWREGPRGEKVWGLGNIRRVLFGLPELLKTAPGVVVAIVEGEKDAVNVAALGIAATTNPHGAGRWRQEYTDWLKAHLPDRRFVILPDNDSQGAKHAEEVYESLKRAGLNVAVLLLPDLPEKGDVSDWIAAGGTGEDLAELLKPPRNPLFAGVVSGPELEELDLPLPEALVPNVVFRGFSTLIAGDSKLGKSSLILRMMLAMATGGWWLDRECRPEHRLPESRVLFLNFEDPLFLTRDRAQKMMRPEGLPENMLFRPVPYEFSFREVCDWLPEAKVELELDAVVLDPIAILAEWTDENDNSEVARTFKALQRVAAESNLAVVSVHHVTKKPGQRGLNIRGGSAIKANVLGYQVLEEDREGRIRFSGINKMTGRWDVILGREERDYSWWIEETEAGGMRTVQQEVRDRQVSELLEVIEGAPGLTAEALAAIVDIPLRTCRSYLADLEEAGVLFSREIPRKEGQRGAAPRGWFAWNLDGDE